MIEERTVVFNDSPEYFIHWSLSELLSFLKVPDDLASRRPKVVDVFFLHDLF